MVEEPQDVFVIFIVATGRESDLGHHYKYWRIVPRYWLKIEGEEGWAGELEISLHNLSSTGWSLYCPADSIKEKV